VPDEILSTRKIDVHGDKQVSLICEPLLPICYGVDGDDPFCVLCVDPIEEEVGVTAIATRMLTFGPRNKVVASYIAKVSVEVR
jgi:hypothetical protein